MCLIWALIALHYTWRYHATYRELPLAEYVPATHLQIRKSHVPDLGPNCPTSAASL